MGKLVQLALLIILGMIANSIFLQVSNIPKAMLLDEGVNRFKFMWFGVQLIWLLLSFKVFNILKHKYWHFHSNR